MEHRTDHKDRRISFVYLTDAAGVLHQLVGSLWSARQTDSFAGLDPEEKWNQSGLLVRVRHNLLRAAESLGSQR